MRGAMPALFTRTSICPYCSNMRPPKAMTASRSLMSRVSAEAEPPEALICETMSSAASLFLSTTRTCAPSAAIPIAMAEPKPRPPPVTTALLPASRVISLAPSCLNNAPRSATSRRRLRCSSYHFCAIPQSPRHESRDPAGSRQDEPLVIVRAHIVTVLPEPRIAADEQQHLALVATHDVLVDSGEPRVGLTQQHPNHQLGVNPGRTLGCAGLGL